MSATTRFWSVYHDQGLELQELPFAESEAREVVRHGGAGSRLLTGREATEARLERLALARFGVLHFAAHALPSAAAPDYSALVLRPDEADDGFLQAREIAELPLRCELVVLSGCQTARGRLVRGEGMQGLAHAFFRAGSRSVLASLWNVRDRGAAQFMEAFYAQLARGLPRTEALRAAKLELLARPGTAEPLSWAPFVLLGEPDAPVPLGASSPGTAWIGLVPAAAAGGGLLAAAAGALLVARRRRARTAGRRERRAA